MPIRVGTRRYPILAGGVAAVKYLLRATFNRFDKGLDDAQVLGAAEGVGPGSLTVVDVEGSLLAIVSNKCAFTAQATPTWGDLGFYSQAITRALGRGLLGTIHLTVSPVSGGYAVGLANAAAVGNPATDHDVGISWIFLGGNYYILPNGVDHGGFTNMAIASYTLNTDYSVAIVLGGYDSNGVPYKQGDTKANFEYGGSIYWKGGSYSVWTLVWRWSAGSRATLYAAISNYDNAGTIELPSGVPDADLSAVLQPTCLSTFTAANSTSLDAVTNEVGGAWTEQVGSWDIQSNRAQTTGSPGIADIDAGVADGLWDSVVTTPASGTTAGGLVARGADYTGGSEDYWYAKISPQATPTSWELIEYAGGTPTQRASGSIAWVAATTYDIRAICDAQDISCFANGGNKINYASASAGETATQFGARDEGAANMSFDNAAFFRRTWSVYDSELDAV